jgi:hypothetical protein
VLQRVLSMGSGVQDGQYYGQISIRLDQLIPEKRDPAPGVLAAVLAKPFPLLLARMTGVCRLPRHDRRREDTLEVLHPTRFRPLCSELLDQAAGFGDVGFLKQAPESEEIFVQFLA